MKYNPFEGKRYKDYDDLEAKEFIFENLEIVKCHKCKKRIKSIEKGYFGYCRLFCKACYKAFCMQASKEVDRAFKGFFDFLF